MRNRRFRALTIFTLILALMISSTSVSFGASKTKKMTVYDNIIKSGKYLYCCDTYGIYRVDINKKTIKKLVKKTGSPDEGYYAMKLKGKNIYCLYSMQGEDTHIYRLSTKKLSQKKLDKKIILVNGYCISGKKLYYSGYDMSTEMPIKRVMKLNGKSEKKSKIRCIMTRKTANTAGYNVVTQDDGKGTFRSWVTFPNGQVLELGRYNYPTY